MISSKFNNNSNNIKLILHNYEFKTEICEIPCGKMYIGINKYINQKVYIKIYDKYKLFTSFKETSFINNEIFILKLLNHKNILHLYEFIESPKLIIVVFEYFKGEKLQNYLSKRKKIDEKSALKIFYEIIKTMYYLHSMNICYLNLNFDNILIEENNNIKIINFRNSCFYEGYMTKDINNGDITFLCPEILAKQAYSPEKADVYSCGIILYYLIMGYFPFNSDIEIKKQELIMKGKYSIPNNIPDNIQNIICNMLENNQDNRIFFKDIINCKWFKDNKNIINNSSINQGINILTQKYPIDNNILKLCKIFSINSSEICKNVEENKFTDKLSIYKQLRDYLYSKKIPIKNDYISEQFKNYINNKENYFTEKKQKENINKYMNDEKEKNQKIKEIEKAFYSNGFKVLEQLKQLKNKYIEQKYIVNKFANKNDNDKFRKRNKSIGKHLKFNTLNTDKNLRPQNYPRKATLKKVKNRQRSKIKSVYVKGPKVKNDFLIPTRKRIYTVRMINYPKIRKISNDLEEYKNVGFLSKNKKKRERGVSFHSNYDKKIRNKLKNINENLDKNRNLNNNDFDVPFRRRIYSTANRKKKIKFAIDNKSEKKNKNSEKKIDNNIMNIKRRRIHTTFVKIEKKKDNSVGKYSNR